MRMRFSRARAASKAGMMTARKWSNGILSRKKNDSLVVIASITSTVSGAAAVVALSLSTRSARPATGGFRRGIAFRPRAPDRSARATSFADSRSPAGSRLVPREQAREAGRDLVKRQHGRAEAGMCDLAGHAPHHAGRLVLRQDAAGGGGDRLRAAQAVRAHAGEHQAEHFWAPDLGGRGKQRVDGRLAEIDQRAVVERDDGDAVAAHDRHVPPAGGEIDGAGIDLLALHRLARRALGEAGEVLGQD